MIVSNSLCHLHAWSSHNLLSIYIFLLVIHALIVTPMRHATEDKKPFFKKFESWLAGPGCRYLDTFCSEPKGFHSSNWLEMFNFFRVVRPIQSKSGPLNTSPSIHFTVSRPVVTAPRGLGNKEAPLATKVKAESTFGGTQPNIMLLWPISWLADQRERSWATPSTWEYKDLICICKRADTPTNRRWSSQCLIGSECHLISACAPGCCNDCH